MVIIRNKVFHGGGDGRMRERPLRAEVPSQIQIRDLTRKFRPTLLCLTPQNRLQCYVDHNNSLGGVERGRMMLYLVVTQYVSVMY